MSRHQEFEKVPGHAAGKKRGFKLLRGDSGIKHPALKVWSSPNLCRDDHEQLWMWLCICYRCSFYLTYTYSHPIPSSPLKEEYITMRRKELLSPAQGVPLLISLLRYASPVKNTCTRYSQWSPKTFRLTQQRLHSALNSPHLQVFWGSKPWELAKNYNTITSLLKCWKLGPDFWGSIWEGVG